MDPVYLLFASMLLLCSCCCGYSALEECGDQQRWLTPAYLTLGTIEVMAAVGLVVWQLQ